MLILRWSSELPDWLFGVIFHQVACIFQICHAKPGWLDKHFGRYCLKNTSSAIYCYCLGTWLRLKKQYFCTLTLQFHTNHYLPGDEILRNICWLAQVVVCCLKAASHYKKKCRLGYQQRCSAAFTYELALVNLIRGMCLDSTLWKLQPQPYWGGRWVNH